MATLAKDGAGWRILFACPTTKKRRTIRTGKCQKKNAEKALHGIESLLEARRLGSALDEQTIAWLKGIDATLRGRLAKAGLVEPDKAALLGPFLDGYIEQRRQRGDVTDSTIEVWGHTRRNLVEFFGENKEMRKITTTAAAEWAAWLKTQPGLAENTIRKRSQFAKRFFSVAVKRKLIPEDPFAALVGTVVSVPERQFFVSRETVNALLDQCHGPEYRLLLAFARYMGVRVPSEIHPLKWTDVDWDGQRVVITSPKTKRHRGGDKRVCPLFPEVLPFLQEAWDAAPEGAVWIFPSIRSGAKNLRTWLTKAILKAGLQLWPRLWVNFRASRATELADKYPSHVAAAWLGHTERIADGHYRQVTVDHYHRAVQEATGAMPAVGTSVKKLAHIPAHSPHVLAFQGSSREDQNPGNSRVCVGVSNGDSPPSGGHGIRTRNPFRGTTFPVWPLAIRLPSLNSYAISVCTWSLRPSRALARSARKSAKPGAVELLALSENPAAERLSIAGFAGSQGCLSRRSRPRWRTFSNAKRQSHSARPLGDENGKVTAEENVSMRVLAVGWHAESLRWAWLECVEWFTTPFAKPQGRATRPLLARHDSNPLTPSPSPARRARGVVVGRVLTSKRPDHGPSLPHRASIALKHCTYVFTAVDGRQGLDHTRVDCVCQELGMAIDERYLGATGMAAGDADVFWIVDSETHLAHAEIARLVPADAQVVDLDTGNGVGITVGDVLQTNRVRPVGHRARADKHHVVCIRAIPLVLRAPENAGHRMLADAAWLDRLEDRSIVRAVVRFIQPKALVQVFLFQERKHQDPPTV